MKYINFVTCISTGAMCIWTLLHLFASKTEKRYEAEKRFYSRKQLLILGVIFAVAILIRIYHFGQIPLGFSQDEAMAAYDARSLEMYGTDHLGLRFPVHMIAWGDSQQSPLLAYFMVPFIRLLGYNVTAVRMPMLILGIAGMLFFCLFVRDLLGARASVCAAFICTFNPWHFVQSRYALDCNVFPDVLMAGLYLLQHGVCTGKKKYIYSGIVILALSHYGYAVSMYALPVFLLFYAVCLYRQRMLDMKEIGICIAIYMVIAGPFLATMILNAAGISNNIVTPLFTIPAFPHTDRRGDMLFWADHPLTQLFQNLRSMFDIAFLQYESVPWDSVEHYGTAFYAMVPIVILGYVDFFRKAFQKSEEKARVQYLMLVGYLFMILCEGAITNTGGMIRRFNIYYYFQMIILVMGMYCIWNYRKKLFDGCIAIYMVLGILLVYSYNTSYTEEFLSPSASSKYIMDAVKQMNRVQCATYYITPSTLYPDSKSVTEIWVLFGMDIDSHYYRGISGQSYERGFEHAYDVQFQYIEANKLKQIDDEDNAVYLINASDKALFDEKKFVSYQYGSFDLEIPVWIQEEQGL